MLEGRFMRKLFFLAVLSLGVTLGPCMSATADEPVLHAPVAIPLEVGPRWAPAFTDYEYLLWNDWAPAFFPDIYSPGWGGWWYMYFGHYYSPYCSPRLHNYPFHQYTHPYFNYPLDSKDQHLYIGLGNNTQPMPDYYWDPKGVLGAAKPAAAQLIVALPEDAKLSVNGVATELTSDRRVFTTPELKPGKDYHYVLSVEVLRDGEIKKLVKEVEVVAGRTSRVQFDVPGSAIGNRPSAVGQ
jgi:uncharacterized protein (TIGR03000 family)